MSDALADNALGSGCPHCGAGVSLHKEEVYLVPDSTCIDFFITCTACTGIWTLGFKLADVDGGPPPARKEGA